jgi:hypothetical protein
MPAGGTATISGSSVTIALKTISGQEFTDTAWTGTGNYYVFFWPSAVPDAYPPYVGRSASNGKINFSSGTTTVPWSQFDALIYDDDEGDNSGNSLTITGITGLTGSVTVILSDGAEENPEMPAGGTAVISGGSVTVALKTVGGSSFTNTAWTGAGDYYVFFWNTAVPSGSPSYIGHDGLGEKISFSSAETTVPWSQFTTAVNWTAVADTTFGNDYSINAIAYGGAAGQEKFVAVGGSRTGQWGAAAAAYSTDGINWTAVTDTGLIDAFGSISFITSIAYGGGKFVAVSSYGSRARAAYSADGVTWTAVGDTKFDTSGINGITYGGGKFVAVGRQRQGGLLR